ncbi:MAG: glycoside hydrolase family 88 protein [Planctomycetota bacterium]
MPTTGALSPTDLSVALYDRYESITEVKHYYGLLAIYGLCRIAELAEDGGALLDRCRAILARFPDQIDHPPYNFPSYRIGGIPRAYMLYRGHMTDEMTKRYVQHYAEEMMLAVRDRDGLMSMPHCPKREQVWIDVAMAVTPYLLFAGLALNEPRYIDESAKQAFEHYRVFRNPHNGLLHQCRGFVGPGRLSTDHWGRGNGWGHIALTELVQHLPADSPHLPEAQRMFVELSDALLPHQSERGLWRQEVPDTHAWEESSATGLILYGYGVGMRLGLLDPDRYGPAFDRGLDGLIDHGIGEDFQTHLCCPGCLCPGEGPRKGTPIAYLEDKQPVDDDGHSFAPIILALGEKLRADR